MAYATTTFIRAAGPSQRVEDDVARTAKTPEGPHLVEIIGTMVNVVKALQNADDCFAYV